MNSIDIDFYKKKFQEARDKYISVVLEAIVDEETFWKYYPQLHTVMPNDGWVDDCPKSIYEWTYHGDRDKGTLFYFDDELHTMLAYKDDEEYCKKYLGNKEIEILNSKSRWEFIQEVLDYTREHKRCGTFFDW